MNETEDRFANRCLPLLVANEAGWVLLNPVPFRVTWNGGSGPGDLEIELLEQEPRSKEPVASHFGHAILTWPIPYLFRTPSGYNLLARGPANWPKDGAQALEGLVETDWASVTFTMNWRITRADHPISFGSGEPICMVVPQRRGELESFRPEIRDIQSDPELEAAYTEWSESRNRMLARKKLYAYAGDMKDARKAWEKHYFQGTSPSGATGAVHQTKLDLAEFRDSTSAPGHGSNPSHRDPSGDADATADESPRPLLALRVSKRIPIRLEPAARWRGWMNETEERFANRCLPLLVANEAGWVLLNPVAFRVSWTGGPTASDVAVEFLEDPEGLDDQISSHFGFGILTWQVPYLFRTPPDYNLLARGPANSPKDGVTALEGVVETDWSTATFTMNWKLTRPDNPVTFAGEEPFCMVVPQRRGELESFTPEIRDIRSDESLAAAHAAWEKTRDRSFARHSFYQHVGDVASAQKLREGDYFRGQSPGGTVAPVHQTKLRLAEFVEQTVVEQDI